MANHGGRARPIDTAAGRERRVRGGALRRRLIGPGLVAAGGRRRGPLLAHPARLPRHREPDARIAISSSTTGATPSTTTGQIWDRYLPHIWTTIRLGAALVARRSRLRLSVCLHPDPQGPLPRARADDDDLPALRAALPGVRALLHPAAERPAGAGARLPRHHGDEAALFASRRCSSGWRCSPSRSWS